MNAQMVFILLWFTSHLMRVELQSFKFQMSLIIKPPFANRIKVPRLSKFERDRGEKEWVSEW